MQDFSLGTHGHRPRKRFGQHFLVDDAVVVQIMRVLLLQENDHVVEIGPGLGALTQKIIDQVGRYDAIEIDRDLVRKLEALYGRRQDICFHCADVLTFDLRKLLQDAESLRLIGNLPYNITTPLLFHLVQYAAIIQDMYFMVQHEVAERLVASPGSKIYGRLSVMMQYYVKIEKLFDVAPSSFMPVPKVYSSFIRIVPFKKLPIVADDEKCFALVVQTAFNQRRKTIRNSLKNLVTEGQWRDLLIDPQLRPEALSLEQFVMISNIVTP